MNSGEYWWDGSGTPDPEFAHLEKSLSVFRPGKARRIPSSVWQAGLALAAALLLVWVAGPERETSRLAVTVLAGSPQAGARVLVGQDTLREGEWLTTDLRSTVELSVGQRGHVRVEPRSRLRIVALSDSLLKLELETGMIHAAAWLPRRQFVVETPAGRAVDLGCEYTLSVDERGAGKLCVETGWVSLEFGTRTAQVPSGAQCEMRPALGPGTPYLAGASTEYLELLRSFDFEPGAGRHVGELIDRASPCDAFSLVYLVERVEPRERGRIFDRVTALYPPWEGITRAGIVALERGVVSSWQDQFECFETEMCRASCLPEWL